MKKGSSPFRDPLMARVSVRSLFVPECARGQDEGIPGANPIRRIYAMRFTLSTVNYEMSYQRLPMTFHK